MNRLDPLDLRGQEDAQHLTEERARLELHIEQGDLRWLMSDKRGRRFVRRSLERAGVWRSSFSANPLEMAFAEGRRYEGLRLLKHIESHCPELCIEMLKESKE